MATRLTSWWGASEATSSKTFVTARRSKREVGAEREGDRRETILRAAVDVFSKKGYQGCRIADVAQAAGVAYGLVYHYFKDKDELLESVFHWAWSGFLERLQSQIAEQPTFEAKVRGVVAVAFEAYKRDPQGVRVLILEVGRNPSGGAANRGQAFTDVVTLAAGMVREAQKAGAVDASVSPEICATMLFGAIEMGLTAFIMGLVPRSAEALEQAREQVACSFLNGVSRQR